MTNDLQAIATTNVNRLNALATLDTGSTFDLAFSPDGSVLATAGVGLISLWDTQTFALLHSFREQYAQSLRFSPDGHLLAVGQTNLSVRMCDPVTGQEVSVLTDEYPGSVGCITFSPNGRLLAFAGGDISSSPMVDFSVWVWDLAAGRRKFAFREHRHWVVSLAFSPDGQLLASGSVDCAIKLWDVETGAKLNTLRDGINEVYSVAFTPDGKLLASSSWLGGIRIWDVKSHALIKHWIGHGGPQPEGTGVGIRVEGLAFNVDGALLASVGGDGVIKLWDVKSYSALLAVEADARPLSKVVFSPNGRLLVTASNDRGKTRIWGITG